MGHTRRIVYPKHSMCAIFVYIGVVWGVNVCIYSIHGVSGYSQLDSQVRSIWTPLCTGATGTAEPLFEHLASPRFEPVLFEALFGMPRRFEECERFSQSEQVGSCWYGPGVFPHAHTHPQGVWSWVSIDPLPPDFSSAALCFPFNWPAQLIGHCGQIP